jgi:hypothetical protein
VAPPDRVNLGQQVNANERGAINGRAAAVRPKRLGLGNHHALGCLDPVGRGCEQVGELTLDQPFGEDPGDLARVAGRAMRRELDHQVVHGISVCADSDRRCCHGTSR